VVDFLNENRQTLIDHLRNRLQSDRNIKWYPVLHVIMRKTDKDGNEITSDPYFRTPVRIILHESDIEQEVDSALEQLMVLIETYLKEGSGWIVDEVVVMDVCTALYEPLAPASFIALPPKLQKTRGIVNIQNQDDRCFMWSALAHLYPQPNNPHRVNHYVPHQHALNMEGISFPVKIKDITKFENQNRITVNVFGYDESVVFPLRITEQRFDSHVNLLMICKGETQHYCLIKDLSKVLNYRTNYNGRTYFCNYCLHEFTLQNHLQDHIEYCKPNGPQRIELPSDDDNILKFKNYAKQLKVPFCIYADFETYPRKLPSCSMQPNSSYVEKHQLHEIASFSFLTVSSAETHTSNAVVYRGNNVMEKFFQSLNEE
jgi:hypothetical protein